MEIKLLLTMAMYATFAHMQVIEFRYKKTLRIKHLLASKAGVHESFRIQNESTLQDACYRLSAARVQTN
eukprot:1785-Heterococcus_DN1.PRE.13